MLPALGGCAAALVVAQAMPSVMRGVAMAGADDVDPFRSSIVYAPPRSDKELAMLDDHILRAECGEPASQFWLGSALSNGFNATPDEVEVYKWFRLAEQGGFAGASEEIVLLSASLSEAEIAQAQARAQAWQARTEGCPAAG